MSEQPIDIVALRKRLEWTQEQLAEYLGVDRSNVSRMEAGQSSVRGPVRRLLAQLSETPDLARVG